MKAAAIFPDKKSLGIVDDFPEPQVAGANDVKLRILNVGVCGTDREIASFVYGEPPEGFNYLVLGHEAVAEVVEAGSGATGFKPGDVVIPMVRHACVEAACVPCHAGRADFCTTGAYRERGIMKMHGFMTEMVVSDASHLNAVPAAIRDVAVLVEPLTIAEKALLQAPSVQSRMPWWLGTEPKRGVVLGAGPVGLLGAMALRRRGYEVTVYSLDREPNASADIVKAIGGKYISSQDLTPEQMAAQVGDIDLVYEATGVSKFAFDVAKVLGHNGIYILTGVPGKHGPFEFDLEALMRNMVLKNQSLLGTVNAGKDAFTAAIEDLTEFHSRWPAAVQALITGRFKIEDFAEPVLHPKGIKNIVEISRPTGAAGAI